MSSANLMIVGVCGHTVMGEQGVQEGAEHTLLWGPSVEGQRSGDVVSYLHHLGVACQKVQDPITQDGVEIQGLQLDNELGGYYGVECCAVVNEQHSYIGIPFHQMGLGSVMTIASSVDLLGRYAN